MAKLIEECSYHLQLAGQLKITLDGNHALNVYADAERIERVILSFLYNCVKYAVNSDQIRINIERIDEMAKVSVTDQGPGITEERQKWIFERDYKGNDEDKNAVAGFGIGLYTSREIIKRHNGKIGVSGNYDEGSTFWFALPLLDRD